MRVAFIQPPVEDYYSTPIRRQPLGLLSLAATARAQGWEVELINGHSPRSRVVPAPPEFDYLQPFIGREDGAAFPFKHYYRFGLSDEAMDRLVRESRADLFAVSALFTPYYRQTERVIESIRRHHPDTPIVVGGGHATLHPRRFLEGGRADYVIRGEGEPALGALLRSLAGESVDLAEYPNLLFAGETQAGDAPAAGALAPVDKLDDLPLPARDFLAPRDFRVHRKRGVMLSFSRGCPHACSFCVTRDIFGPRHRAMGLSRMMAEIVDCHERHGALLFDFEDDNFFANPDADALLEEMTAYGRRRGVEFDLVAMNGLGVEGLNPERLRLMRRAGFRDLDLSLVTGDARRQRGLGRPADSDRFAEIVREARKLEMPVRAYFILGLPEQTEEEALATIATIREAGARPVPSVYYDTMKPEPADWLIQRSSAFANESAALPREKLLRIFNELTGRW